jgi:anti-sigma regulatory factor (Ser/Thr protein kinase)
MIAIPTEDMSRVADVRRRAFALAGTMGFDELATAQIGIVVTELVTNLVKFGTSGELLLGAFEDSTGTGVEAIAVDRGPGLDNVERALRDGYSTSGTSGQGLGAVRRLCSAFDVTSWPDVGTGVLARVHLRAGGTVAVATIPQSGHVVVPVAGEIVSGDAICIRVHNDGWTVFVADGLGHGPLAAQAASEAVRIFRSVEHAALTDILTAVHEGIRHTRGAAIAVCRYIPEAQLVRYAGVGNIEGRIVTGTETKRMVSHAGTAGLALRRTQEFEYAFEDNSVLVMHSDGLTTSWSASAMPGLYAAHPTLVAAMLYRQFSRGRDDAAVIVVSGAGR